MANKYLKTSSGNFLKIADTREIWTFNDTVAYVKVSIKIPFTSNNLRFDTLATNLTNIEYVNTNPYRYILPYSILDQEWYSPEYKTVIFDYPPTGTARDWLATNATLVYSGPGTQFIYKEENVDNNLN